MFNSSSANTLHSALEGHCHILHISDCVAINLHQYTSTQGWFMANHAEYLCVLGWNASKDMHMFNLSSANALHCALEGHCHILHISDCVAIFFYPIYKQARLVHGKPC